MEESLEVKLKRMTESCDYWYKMYKEAIDHYAGRLAEAETKAQEAIDMARKIREKIAEHMRIPTD